MANFSCYYYGRINPHDGIRNDRNFRRTNNLRFG